MDDGAHTAAAQGSEFAMLSRAYMDYKVCAQSPANVNSKCQLNSVTEELQSKGIYGNNALHLLASLKQQIGWQGMHQEEFRRFYQFVFFVCRERGKRNVQVPVAIAAWRELLSGRFRLLDRWCAYMTDLYKALVVTEDTWVQVLEFSRTVHEDLSNYDPTAAWPVALDEFVEHLRRSAKKPAEPMDLYNPWPQEQLLSAVSPRSGSKRRMQPAVAEVAEQLQQLPLACPNSQQHHQQQQPTAAVLDRPRPGHHTVKRYRVSGPAPVAPSAPAAAAGGAGFRSPQAAGQRGCEACDVMMGSPMSAPRMAGGLHPMSKSMAAASSRPSAAMCGHPQQQQQEALGVRQDGSSGGGIFSFGAGSDPSTSIGAAWGECMNNLGAGQHHQPPAGRAVSGDALRCSSMNAMMQATVTDTLFYT